MMIGPKVRSRRAPMIVSVPLRTISETSTPSMCGVRLVGPAVPQDGLVGVDDFVLVVQVQGHAAGIALVQDVAGDHFHDHRVADLLGRPHGLVQAAGDRCSGESGCRPRA